MKEPKADTGDRHLAEYYNGKHNDSGWGEPELLSKPERLEVTLSVRFTPAEIATLRARAADAGLKPTAYIRRCALAAEEPPIYRAGISHCVDALARDLDDLRRAAG